MAKPKRKLKEVEKPKLLRLDLGCGPNPREGFEGVDIRQFNGVVDHVLNIAERKKGVEPWRVMLEPSKETCEMFKPWPWKNNSVEEVHTSHFVEHLWPTERTHFVNELYRVLIPEGKCTLIVPHWNSARAYGDLTHKMPPVCEMWFSYLLREWRAINAPHNDFYDCDFHVTWGYSPHEALVSRNQEYQQHAMMWWKESCQDIHATLIKR